MIFSLSPLNLKKWITEHRSLLKPPLGNQAILQNDDCVVMAVGGPNVRSDYHINPTPEFFYQVEGEMVLQIVEDGQFLQIPIGEGEVFLLPAGIPHSPQRFENTVGVVVEQKRPVGSLDTLIWYCENCHQELYRESFELSQFDFGAKLKPIMSRFFGDEQLRTCRNCGVVQ